MKKSELLKALNKYSDDIEVQFECSIITHTCGDSYCYCTPEDIRFYIRDVDKETLDAPNYKGIQKKLKNPIILLRGDKL